MVKHSNIAVFVPHIGCPNRCSFCDQTSITGQIKPATAEDVKKAVEIAAASKNYDPLNTEIAFFGGSFTAIKRDYMLSLLSEAYKYVNDNTVCGIRISTRPDAINNEILEILKQYGVTSVEIGAQSTNDEVLSANLRGHTKKDIFDASALIKEKGFSLGLQMMTGLYKSNDATDIKTAFDFCSLKPDTVRVYPTIVLKNTYLDKLLKEGIYIPQSLENAVSLCVGLMDIFKKNNINVIRLGLHSIEKESYSAGPWHPSFSELCSNEIYYNKILDLLSEKGNYTVFVNSADISKAVGQKKKNIIRFKEKGYNIKIIGSDVILKEEIKVIKDV